MASFRICVLAAAFMGLFVAACQSPTPTPPATYTPYPTYTPFPTATHIPPPPTSTATPLPSPTPTATPVPLTAAQVLAMSREQIERVITLRVEMSGGAEQGDVSFAFTLEASIDRPDSAHGMVEVGGEQYEFLRLPEGDYVAWYGLSFEKDYYNESGTVFLDILDPLLEPGDREPFTDLERQPDQVVEGRTLYQIAFRMDMREFIERLTEEQRPGLEIIGRGELLIDRESLLPQRFTVNCKSCLLSYQPSMDLTLAFVLSEFNQPVHIPSPRDVSSLLADPCAPIEGLTGPGGSWETALPVAVGDTVVGDLPSSQCRHLFSFNALGGETYLVQTQLISLGDSVLSLLDTDGETELTYNDDYLGLESRIVWKAPQDGTYYVSVEDLSSTGGTYRLTIRLAQPEEEATLAPQPTPTAQAQ